MQGEPFLCGAPMQVDDALESLPTNWAAVWGKNNDTYTVGTSSRSHRQMRKALEGDILNFMRNGLLIIAGISVVAAGYYAWTIYGSSGLPDGIARGNGRIEATEVDVSAKAGGRIKEILVNEGDYVTEGHVLANMDTLQLQARRRQAEAALQRAVISIDTAKSTLDQREAEKKAALAVVSQRKSELGAAEGRLARSEQLMRTNTTSQQVLDDDRARAQNARAAVAAAEASVGASNAAISAARAMIVDASAAVDAARAEIESIEADIDDGTLRSPRDGRIQYRIAQPGEILSPGGKVINLVDLGDVYMTFFLPTVPAGRIAIGSDVLLVLDAAPEYTIPATVSFIADVAQFTPKTVETTEERQKLMFRIKAKVSQELLRRYVQHVKTGLPGVAYIRTDPATAWPENLSRNLVK